MHKSKFVQKKVQNVVRSVKKRRFFLKISFQWCKISKKFKLIRIPEDDLFKHCKYSKTKKIQICALLKIILKPMLSQYLRNEKRYRKNLCGFEIPDKR